MRDTEENSAILGRENRYSLVYLERLVDWRVGNCCMSNHNALCVLANYIREQ
jgi:hypothetical protein